MAGPWPLSWGSPVTPHDPQPPCHLLQVILQLPEHGLQVRDLLRQAPGFWPEDMGFRTQWDQGRGRHHGLGSQTHPPERGPTPVF